MLRKARIKWDTVPNATSYTIQPSGSNEEKITGITKNYEDIDLDDYLADNTADTFKVKAVSSNASYSDSDWSTTIKIVDNPILRADGDNSDAADSATTGNAKIEWKRISGVTKYTVKYRRLGGTRNHATDTAWRANTFVNLDHGSTVTDSNPSSSARLKHTRNNLRLGEIYAIQLNYEQNGQKVFSGRDMFVWPSKGFPAIGKRVATYPFVGHWADKEYSYRICEETFPEGKQDAWTKLIEHAFEQWEYATDGLITMTHDESGECSDLSVIETALLILQVAARNPRLGALSVLSPLTGLLIDGAPFAPLTSNADVQEDDRQSEIRMFGGVTSVSQFPEMLTDPFKLCIFFASACVTSISGYSDARRQASSEFTGVDVTFKKSSFNSHELTIPGGGNSIKKNDPFFTGCVPNYYYPYRTALHEAGHALGLSGWSATQFVLNSYRMAHSTIPDSVMNYNEEIPENFNPNFVDSKGNKTGIWLRQEPDCFPHPIDVMAIYALYQTVDDDE